MKLIFKIIIILLASYCVVHGIFAIFGYNLTLFLTPRTQSMSAAWQSSMDYPQLQTTLNLIPKNLIFGVGWGNATFYLPYFGYVTFAPNLYLNILFETGIFGLSIFLIFLGALLLSTWRALKKIEDTAWQKLILSLFVAVLSLLICFLFVSWWTNNPFLWVLIGMLAASVKLGLQKEKSLC